MFHDGDDCLMRMRSLATSVSGACGRGGNNMVMMTVISVKSDGVD